MTRNPSDRRHGMAIIGGLAAALVATVAARAEVPITTCGYTISTPGNYILTADLNSCPGDGIDITVSNVNLDLEAIRSSDLVVLVLIFKARGGSAMYRLRAEV